MRRRVIHRASGVRFEVTGNSRRAGAHFRQPCWILPDQAAEKIPDVLTALSIPRLPRCGQSLSQWPARRNEIVRATI